MPSVPLKIKYLSTTVRCDRGVGFSAAEERGQDWGDVNACQALLALGGMRKL